MSKWIVKEGNRNVQEILILDRKGEVVNDLDEAEKVKFQVRTKDRSRIIIEKTKDDIKINKPEKGYLRIVLLPDDTKGQVGLYVMGLEIHWSDKLIYECYLEIDGQETEIFEILENVIR